MGNIFTELITIIIATTIICIICSSISSCCFLFSPLITNLENLPGLIDSVSNNYDGFKTWLECTFSLGNLKDIASEKITPEWLGGENSRAGTCVFPFLSEGELKRGGEICTYDGECEPKNSDGKGKCNCSRGGLSVSEATDGGFCRCEHTDDTTNLPDLAYCPSGKDSQCLSGLCACPRSDWSEDSSGGACRCLPTDDEGNEIYPIRGEMDYTGGDSPLMWTGVEKRDHWAGSFYPSSGDFCHTGSPSECPDSEYCRCNFGWRNGSINQCTCVDSTRLEEAGDWQYDGR